MSAKTLFSDEIHPGAARRPGTLLSAIALQLLLAGAALLYPMLWPETLPVVSASPTVATVRLRSEPPPPLPKPEPRPSDRALPASLSLHTGAAPAHDTGAAPAHETTRPLTAAAPAARSDEEEPVLLTGSLVNAPLAFGTALSGTGGGGGDTAVVARSAAAPRPAPVRLSSGVTSGLLLSPILPAYPSIAKMSRVEGTVVITATISRDGRVVGAKVVSGPELLRSSALDAVRGARYQPYELNGAPTEVLTTVSITFRLGS